MRLNEKIVVEKELSDFEKSQLVIRILKLLIGEGLSNNQITQILDRTKSQAGKIPISVSESKSG